MIEFSTLGAATALSQAASPSGSSWVPTSALTCPLRKLRWPPQMAAANDLSHILRFEHGDAADLPEELVRALAPDIVLLLEVLEHVNDPIAVLQAVSEITETDPLIIFRTVEGTDRSVLGSSGRLWG